MDAFATNLIATLGGSTAVARKMAAPTTTVQSWKENGIPRSRLEHLRLIAAADGKPIDWETGRLVASDGEAADHAASDTTDTVAPSSGKAGEISAPQVLA